MSRPPVPGSLARDDRFDQLSQNVDVAEQAVERLGYL
jgi:hypothetical protein